MTAHHQRIGRLLLVVALFASAFGALVVVDGTAMAASKAHCDTTIEPGEYVLEVDGFDVLLYVPESAPDRHVPLVVNPHPSGGTGEQMLHGFYASMHVADDNGFAMLAPTGVAASLFGGWQWNVPGVPLFLGLPIANDRDDVEFIEHAIDAASEAMCIDQARVYVTGFAGGARMASQLACDLADRVAAVAPIAGIRFPLASDAALGLPDSQDCDPVRNIPSYPLSWAPGQTNFGVDGFELAWDLLASYRLPGKYVASPSK